MIKLIFIFIFLITFTNCKKDKIISSNTTPKWNEKFIGNYKGIWTSQSYGMGVTGVLYTKDTTLVIGINNVDSTLTTSLSNCRNIIYKSDVSSFYIYHGRIDFRNDSMYYVCGNGGLGGGNNETFKGKKVY